MPQTFHVLRCGDCETFQVLQVTKTNKWKCKLCGRSQSIVKVFGTGSGADCRRHVQKLNRLRGDREIAKANHQLELLESGEDENWDSYINSSGVRDENRINSQPTAVESRWSGFLDEAVDNCGDEDELLTFDGQDQRPWSSSSQNMVTTDWSEYQANRRELKRRRTDMRQRWSARGNKSRTFPGNHCPPDSREEKVESGDYLLRSEGWGQRDRHFTEGTLFFNKRKYSGSYDTNNQTDVLSSEAEQNRSTAWNDRVPNTQRGDLSHHDQGEQFEHMRKYHGNGRPCSDSREDRHKGGLGSRVNISTVTNVSNNKKSSELRTPSQTVPASSKWGAFIETGDDSDAEIEEESDVITVDEGGHLLVRPNIQAQTEVKISSYPHEDLAGTCYPHINGDNNRGAKETYRINVTKRSGYSDVVSVYSTVQRQGCTNQTNGTFHNSSLDIVDPADGGLVPAESNMTSASADDAKGNGSLSPSCAVVSKDDVSVGSNHTGVLFDLGFDIDTDDLLDL